jgi:hypothetical protein
MHKVARTNKTVHKNARTISEKNATKNIESVEILKKYVMIFKNQ